MSVDDMPSGKPWPVCTGQFADAETCPIHGPEIRDARNRARAYHDIVLQHRDDVLSAFPHAEAPPTPEEVITYCMSRSPDNNMCVLFRGHSGLHRAHDACAGHTKWRDSPPAPSDALRVLAAQLRGSAHWGPQRILAIADKLDQLAGARTREP